MTKTKILIKNNNNTDNDFNEYSSCWQFLKLIKSTFASFKFQ